eukprot:4361513-Pyramimonas_sp.AAC.1
MLFGCRVVAVPTHVVTIFPTLVCQWTTSCEYSLRSFFSGPHVGVVHVFLQDRVRGRRYASRTKRMYDPNVWSTEKRALGIFA